MTLVTCFSPFGTDTVNASREAVTALPDMIGGEPIVKVELPTSFGRSIARLREAIAQHRPDVVICTGQAGGRFGITPERVAINIKDARMADNDGHQPTDEPIVADGPAAYFSTLPIKEMVAAMQEAGIPASVSNSAGTFVCNEVMYALLHIIHTEHPQMRGGFIHVPFTPAQAAAKVRSASMLVVDMARGLEICIRTIGKHAHIRQHDN